MEFVLVGEHQGYYQYRSQYYDLSLLVKESRLIKISVNNLLHHTVMDNVDDNLLPHIISNIVGDKIDYRIVQHESLHYSKNNINLVLKYLQIANETIQAIDKLIEKEGFELRYQWIPAKVGDVIKAVESHYISSLKTDIYFVALDVLDDNTAIVMDNKGSIHSLAFPEEYEVVNNTGEKLKEYYDRKKKIRDVYDKVVDQYGSVLEELGRK